MCSFYKMTSFAILYIFQTLEIMFFLFFLKTCICINCLKRTSVSSQNMSNTLTTDALKCSDFCQSTLYSPSVFGSARTVLLCVSKCNLHAKLSFGEAVVTGSGGGWGSMYSLACRL